MAEIHQYSPVLFYEQLANIIRERIQSGELQRLDPLPSEATLEQDFGVGRDTVRKALAVLRDEGVIFTLQARGSYVGPAPDLVSGRQLPSEAIGLPQRKP